MVVECNSSSSATPSTRLRAITFNAWLLPFGLSPNNHERTVAICQELKKLQPDVVAFQEVWTKTSCNILQQKGRELGMIYQYGSPDTGGLLLMSRFPLEEATFTQYTNKGFPLEFQHGEFLAKKGIISAKLCSPTGVVRVVTTHMIANYEQSHDSKEQATQASMLPEGDMYRSHRAGQIVELLDELQQVGEPNDLKPTIVLTDANLEQQDDILLSLLTLSCLKDASGIATPPASEAFASSCQDDKKCYLPDECTKIASKAYNQAYHSARQVPAHPACATVNAIYSPYRHPNADPQKLDYIFFRSANNLVIRPRKARLALTGSWKASNDRKDTRLINLHPMNTERCALTAPEISSTCSPDAASFSTESGYSSLNVNAPSGVLSSLSQSEMLYSLLSRFRNNVDAIRHKARSSRATGRRTFSDHCAVLVDFELSTPAAQPEFDDDENSLCDICGLHACDDGVSTTDLLRPLAGESYIPFIPANCKPFLSCSEPVPLTQQDALMALRSAIDRGVQDANRRKLEFLMQAGIAACATTIGSRLFSGLQPSGHQAAQRTKTVPRWAYRLGRLSIFSGGIMSLGFSGLGAFSLREERRLRTSLEQLQKYTNSYT